MTKGKNEQKLYDILGFHQKLREKRTDSNQKEVYNCDKFKGLITACEGTDKKRSPKVNQAVKRKRKMNFSTKLISVLALMKYMHIQVTGKREGVLDEE
eukprot:snap_masked-scaffold_15-processed-gene-0.2-mRNA-1 protein AED:1.00 eAED:1.00 QI:0/0/0/0/1/1/2/0/97